MALFPTWLHTYDKVKNCKSQMTISSWVSLQWLSSFSFYMGRLIIHITASLLQIQHCRVLSLLCQYFYSKWSHEFHSLVLSIQTFTSKIHHRVETPSFPPYFNCKEKAPISFSPREILCETNCRHINAFLNTRLLTSWSQELIAIHLPYPHKFCLTTITPCIRQT